MRIHVTLLFLFVFLLTGISQSVDRCGADHFHNEQMQIPAYNEAFKSYKKLLNQSIEFQRSVNCTNPVLIPIAVHFNGNITNQDPNCLISKCFEQIEVMNADFGAYNLEINKYQELAENCPSTYPINALSSGICIQFYLASRNHPSCESPGNLIGGYAITVGQYSWPNTGGCWSGYLNIFVEDDLPHLGFAPVGGASNPNGNGIQINSGAFGGLATNCVSGLPLDNLIPYNLGRTGSHEAGHYFGLEHTFHGCSNGDNIADTPDQSESNQGKPEVDSNTCLSTAVNSCGSQDFFFNFMDYVDDDHMWMFTDDQCQVMQTTAEMASWELDKGDPILRSKYIFDFRDINDNSISLVDSTDLIFTTGSNTSTVSAKEYLVNNSFTFPSPNIPPLNDLSVAFSNDTNLLKSVSAFDLILIQKHLLIIDTFSNPLKLLTSDTNASNSVSASDLIDIQKALLKINTSFFGKDSYSFYFENCNYCETFQLPAPNGNTQTIKVYVLKNGNVN